MHYALIQLYIHDTESETYFAKDYVSNDEDPHVVDLVKKAKFVLDVGVVIICLKNMEKVLGLDPLIPKQML